MLAFFHSAPTMCWLVLFIAFLVLEGMTTTLICLWFGVGALVALLISLLTNNLWVQAFSFAIVSLVTLILIRPIVGKTLQRKGTTATNADRLLGRAAIVTQTIDELAGTGQVKVSGLEWTARTIDGSVLPVGSRVTVRSIEGVKLMVTPVSNEVNSL